MRCLALREGTGAHFSFPDTSFLLSLAAVLTVCVVYLTAGW